MPLGDPPSAAFLKKISNGASIRDFKFTVDDSYVPPSYNDIDDSLLLPYVTPLMQAHDTFWEEKREERRQEVAMTELLLKLEQETA